MRHWRRRGVGKCWFPNSTVCFAHTLCQLIEEARRIFASIHKAMAISKEFARRMPFVISVKSSKPRNTTKAALRQSDPVERENMECFLTQV
jgi:hypothetical protein